jgi:hypothetical protein
VKKALAGHGIPKLENVSTNDLERLAEAFLAVPKHRRKTRKQALGYADIIRAELAERRRRDVS